MLESLPPFPDRGSKLEALLNAKNNSQQDRDASKLVNAGQCKQTVKSKDDDNISESDSNSDSEDSDSSSGGDEKVEGGGDDLLGLGISMTNPESSMPPHAPAAQQGKDLLTVRFWPLVPKITTTADTISLPRSPCIFQRPG